MLQTLTLPDIGNINGPLKTESDSLGGLVSSFLPYIFVAAGLILFLIIIFAGFTMFTSAQNPEKAKQAKAQLTFGLVGFLVVVLSYTLATIIGNIFGITLLGT